jgi:O-antigen/teichoic acid export membrane protein
MLRRFFKDSAIYAVSSAITGSLAILLLPYLTRKLTLQEYGVTDLLLSSFTIINVLVALEISQALARYYPTIDENERYRYASTGLWFVFLMYVLFSVLSMIFLEPINDILIGDSIYVSVTAIAFFSMLTFGIFSYLQIQLRWMLKPVEYVISNILFIVISFGLTVGLIEYTELRADGFFIARIIASVAGIGLVWHYSKQNYRFIFDLKILKIMLAFSLPLVISSAGIFVSLYVDRFIIRALLSLQDVGIYSACARIASIAGSILTAINFALTPLIYSRYQDPKTPGDLAYLFKWLVYVMLIITLLLLIFSKQILTTMLGKDYTEGYLLLPLLVASFIVAGLYNCTPGLWIAKKTKLIATINIATAVLNTVLCLVLIPYFGYVGAAMATLISAIATLVASTSYAQKYYYISYDWLRINFAVIVTALCAYLILHY